MTKLSLPTPKRNTKAWTIGSFFYVIMIVINEYFDTICALGFPEAHQDTLKAVGVLLYVAFTFRMFNQTPKTPFKHESHFRNNRP